MNSALNPKTVRKPGGAYTHTVRVPADADWLVISGQVGVDIKGKLAEGPRKQSEQVFKNLLACLRENGMRKQDLVKFTVYLTDSRYIDDYRAARRKIIGDDALPTSTLVIVDGLAAPDMLVEIEAWAAKSPRRSR
ncbi:MAG: enamine deaminase RidA [Thiotrichales bacterium]|nr:enamine deaminase RidA [Thiotrichales bacterium]|tara:strand:- start:147 stop:551 length:405 start_codon:yes stop_codon:yes gene_type:complete